MTTHEKLNALADLHDIVNAAKTLLDERKAFLMAPVNDAIERAEAEYQTAIGTAANEAWELQQEIAAEVKEAGASVKGDALQAVYTKGRTSWDSKMLVGFALAHPEINDAKKVGKPSVSFREVKSS